MPRSDQITSIVQLSEQLALKTGELLGFLSDLSDEKGRAFDVSQPIPSKDSSVADVAARIQALTGIVAKFESAKQGELVPLAQLKAFSGQLNDVTSSIDETIKYFIAQITPHGITLFNYDNFHITLKNNQQVNCQAQFDAFFANTETLLGSFFSLVHILRPQSPAAFQSAASALSGLIEKTNSLHAESRESLKNIADESVLIEADRAAAQKAKDEIARLHTEADSERKTIAEYLAKATESKSSIEAVNNAALELKSQVDAYQQQFKEFQASLDNRNKSFVNGSKQLEQLLKFYETNKETVEGLISRSEEMLSAATVAGLASHFGNIKNDLNKELASAQGTFYWGIGFMFFSSVPLLVLILLPAFGPLLMGSSYANLADTLSASSQSGWQYLGQVVARLVILVPAAWFVSFCALRYSSLFQLREHYAYKYSMAVSVEGFKKEAPEYEQEIAALVLEQLAFNPADKLAASKDGQECKSPNPIMRFLLEKVKQKTESQT